MINDKNNKYHKCQSQKGKSFNLLCCLSCLKKQVLGQSEHLCCLTRLYTVGLPTLNSHPDILKIDNGI